MKVLYDSQHYCVSEFPGYDGIELVDKLVGRSGYLEGEVLARFRALMLDQITDDPTDEAVDEFLDCYGALLTQRILLH
jgi:hypothetical protein